MLTPKRIAACEGVRCLWGRTMPVKYRGKRGTSQVGPFELKNDTDAKQALHRLSHIYCTDVVCETDRRGFRTPQNRTPLELVVDASNGFIPLWDKDVTLNWRFNAQTVELFVDPDAVKDYVRNLLGNAILAWGPAVPVRFSETREPWDFEIAVRSSDNCGPLGCTLGRAFFPDAGQHDLVLFPRLFREDYAKQVDVMAHEFGHIFGLRHFFAQVSETAFPSEIFGTHEKFSIMNYGAESRLTETDVADLIHLYKQVWSGELLDINGTPVRLMRPYSYFRMQPLFPLPMPLAAAQS